MTELIYSHFVENRRNVHALNGHEWALQIIINDKKMTLVAYDSEPTEAEVAKDLEVFERSIDIYKWALVGFFSFPSAKKRQMMSE